MIRKEWLRNLLEPRFLLCAALCIFLALVSVLVLRADLAAKRADYSSNREIYHQQAEEYGSYRDLQRRGIRVDRPPQDFQVLFLGTEKTMDRTAEVTGDFMPGFAGDLNINPMVLMFPVADLLFIVGVVLSLLAFFISYDAVAGEREEGTLMLLLSYAVPRDTVILAKWIGGYLSLALPFIVSLLVSALLISLSSEIPFEGQNWQAFIVTGAVSLLLIAVMFSIGLLVSVRTRRSVDGYFESAGAVGAVGAGIAQRRPLSRGDYQPRTRCGRNRTQDGREHQGTQRAVSRAVAWRTGTDAWYER
jgi:hypothetical protein